jgi:four helix bundle protein
LLAQAPVVNGQCDDVITTRLAAGSASEAEYQLLLAKDLAYLVPQVQHELDEQINEIKPMLNAFIKTLAAG